MIKMWVNVLKTHAEFKATFNLQMFKCRENIPPVLRQ